MKPNTPRLVVSLLMLCMTFTASAEIYKWTDADGNTHYSQTPPENTATKSEDIGDKIGMAAGTAQSSDAPVKKDTAESDDFAKAKEEGKENAIQHQSYCDQQQEALKKLLANPIIRWKSDESIEKVLTAKEREAKIAEFEKTVKEMCNEDVLPQKEKVAAQ